MEQGYNTYRERAATGGSHPTTHTFARKPQISCKVPAGRSKSTRAGQLYPWDQNFTRISSPFAPALGTLWGRSIRGCTFSAQLWLSCSVAPRCGFLQHHPQPPLQGCMDAQGDPYGCPRGHCLKMTGYTSEAAHAAVHSQLLSRAPAHAEVLPPRLGGQGKWQRSACNISHPAQAPTITATPSFPTGVFPKAFKGAASPPRVPRTHDIPTGLHQNPTRCTLTTEKLQVL